MYAKYACGQTVRESERDRKWKSSVYSAKDLFTLRQEEDGHPRVICAEQWAASAPEGIADPKIYSQKTHCKAQALPEHSAIRISLNRTAACATAMVTGEKARGRAGGHIIHNYLQQNSSLADDLIKINRWQREMQINYREGHSGFSGNCLTFALMWHHSPSAPIETSFTPLLAIKSRALLTLEILWTLILPLSGLAKRSPGQETHFQLQKNIFWLAKTHDILQKQCNVILILHSELHLQIDLQLWFPSA